MEKAKRAKQDLKSEKIARQLKEIYYNPRHPASLGSINALAAAAKLPKRTVKEWLMKQPTYTLHRNASKRYPTRKYYVNTIDDQWQMDLADMVQVQRQNHGYRYILTCIDILSRFAWARPLKSKSGKEVAAAIEDIFSASGRIPKRIQTDQGREFYNAPVQQLLTSNNVELFSVKSPNKAALVERFNRTLKNKLWRMFTSRNNHKWINDLAHVMHAYNHAIHRVIRMKPANVNKENAMIIWERLYGKDPRNQSTLRGIKKDDIVRISSVKGQFEQGYLPNWSREEFIVDKVNKKFLPNMVQLKDHHGEVIEGGFYDKEVQRIGREKDDDVYDVEKIIRQKKKDGEVWYLVKWLGYNNSFNSWVRKRDIVHVYNKK